MKENPIRNKSFEFAVLAVKMARALKESTKDYELINQFVRSGTSVGANVVEAIQGQSRRDFISKMSIALKEAHETRYWLDLFRAINSINDEQHKFMLKKVNELVNLLTAIIKTAKKNS